MILRGIFAVNKPKNITSVEVLEEIKKILLEGLGPKINSEYLKVGHGGTLDHTATGVLVVGVGQGCKLLKKFLHGNKKYRVVGHLGKATDTYNVIGSITEECLYDHITREMLERTLCRFHGDILQTPPLYSALKFQGQRLADLTRAGVHVMVKPRVVTCHAIQCVDFSPPLFTLDVHSGGGFYIRSLVHDLGKALDSCAHVKELHRFQHGPFTEHDVLEPNEWTVENILAAINRAKEIRSDFVVKPSKKLKYQCEARTEIAVK